ncbi:UvrD-helicase domain-containing protein [Spirochaeta isovalerica]|uniref:RecBCD enzyme subunit RecB n=1 Tax=Spirochaeta isovalerica TaxID=150 RepID=A0A841REK7_9SPIO|nr:UvrD-helicase domain-containing protein [Spirochaeta isovalerica]MBB6482046.1 exodeoxyribonuclease V beta subunit [Spirochaeta isovalerica]
MSLTGNFSFSENIDLLRNIQLEASAGTGKTYTIERIVSLLVAEGPLTLPQILVVTFTRKAARELKERIRIILNEASRTGELDLGGDKRKLKSKELDNIRQAVYEFEKASIFTIHSFCLNVLKAYPFESLSQFSMDMESDGDIIDEAVRDYMREMGESMDRGQLIKYKAFLGNGGYEEALADLGQMVGRELLGPGIEIQPDREHRREILESIMDFNNGRGALHNAWCRMRGGNLPDKERFTALGFKYANHLENAVLKLQKIPVETDLISLSVFISQNETILNQFMRFLPENLGEKNNPESIPPDPFVQAAEDFLDLYLFDKDNPGADLYRRAMKAAFIIEAYDSINNKLKRKKAITGKLDFNDLIGRLHQGLCSSGDQYRPELVREIRKRYRTVLIDEFQDTDQRQWDIFQKIFGCDDNHNFFLVGDPKQSIYRFRGADLEVYYQACRGGAVDGRYTLGKNFRSISPLVEGVNRFFSSVLDPALHCGHTSPTSFAPVEAGKPAAPKVEDGEAAFQFIRIESEENEEGISDIAKGKNTWFQLISYKSYVLLAGTKIGDRRIKPGDIAILAESNKDCRVLQSYLSSYSIPSIINSRERIFDTGEAADLLLFLKALIRMDNSTVKQLLMSRFYDRTPGQVVEGEAKGEFDYLTGLLLQWREMVDRGKIIEASRDFFRNCELEERLLAFQNGERSYSNFRQLIEFLHGEQLRSHLDAEKLYALLLGKICEPSRNDEDLIRLDKDSEAVQIMTMHASKGLEFPIVFFAGALKSGGNSGREIFYDYVESEKRHYDFLKTKKNEKYHLMDSWEERKRLYYVALTRASSRLYMPFFKNGGLSYLTSLYSSFAAEDIERIAGDFSDLLSFSHPLHSGLLYKKNSKKKKSDIKILAETIDGALCGFIGKHREIYFLDSVLEREFLNHSSRQDCLYREDNEDVTPVFKPLKAEAGYDDRYIRISSYSSILREAERGREPAPARHNDADRDDVAVANRDEKVDEVLLTRGAVFGELVHRIFEEMDYSLAHESTLEDFLKNEEADRLLRDLSVRFFDNKWYARSSLPLKKLVYRTLRNGLPHGCPSLSVLKGEERLHEMEFHMTVNECSRLMVDSAYAGEVEDGLLKGFIDLIFIYEGKYYIADWKTTSSPKGDTYDDYSPDILAEMMDDHHYKLQSLIYITALYRYLKSLEGDIFDYEEHFGGCYYFFVRGMNGEADSDRGIHFYRPAEGEMLSFASQFTPLEAVL